MKKEVTDADKKELKCRFCITYEVCKRCGRHVCEADGYHYLNHEREDFEIEFEKKFGISLVKLKRYFEDGFKP